MKGVAELEAAARNAQARRRQVAAQVRALTEEHVANLGEMTAAKEKVSQTEAMLRRYREEFAGLNAERNLLVRMLEGAKAAGESEPK